MHLANLSDDELNKIKAPAIVYYGLGDLEDVLHPRHTAHILYEKLPTARWAEYSEKEIHDCRKMNENGTFGDSTRFAFYAPFFEDFLQQVEAGTFVPNKE